jgi:hypothetical protein
MVAVVTGQFVQGSPASLWQDYGMGSSNCRKIIRVRLPSGTEYIFICFKAGVIRQNHQ